MKTYPHKDLYLDAHSNIIQNNVKLETTQMSFNWRMHLNKIWDINLMKCNSIIKATKYWYMIHQEQISKYYVQRKKRNAKEHILYGAIYTKLLPQKANLEEEKIVFFKTWV